MKRPATGSVLRRWPIAGAALLAGALCAAPGSTQVKAPSDFAIAKSETSPGQVIFSHDKHRKKVEKCTSCHMRDFKMKRGASGPITLEAKQEGKFCGACHDGKTEMDGVTVFPIDECDKCHK
jgi:c(7)-type cytochrome triheme protein